MNLPHLSSYRRRLPVNLARMYENALDWEHLPWLHSSSFSHIRCLDAGDWGWRAVVGLKPADSSLVEDSKAFTRAVGKSLLRHPFAGSRFLAGSVRQILAGDKGVDVTIELRLDREAQRWITTTLDGPGAGSQIWTHVFERGDEALDIVVDFFMPGLPPPLQPVIGAFYVNLYTKLYDEDVSMMSTRQQALARRRAGADKAPQDLGVEAQVRAQLPLILDHGGRRFRLVDDAGTLRLHAADCPHWLGPLDDAPLQDGIVECPWHGYQFNIRDGSCVSGQRCKLPKPPKLQLTNGRVLIA